MRLDLSNRIIPTEQAAKIATPTHAPTLIRLSGDEGGVPAWRAPQSAREDRVAQDPEREYDREHDDRVSDDPGLDLLPPGSPRRSRGRACSSPRLREAAGRSNPGSRRSATSTWDRPGAGRRGPRRFVDSPRRTPRSRSVRRRGRSPRDPQDAGEPREEVVLDVAAFGQDRGDGPAGQLGREGRGDVGIGDRGQGREQQDPPEWVEEDVEEPLDVVLDAGLARGRPPPRRASRRRGSGSPTRSPGPIPRSSGTSSRSISRVTRTMSNKVLHAVS